jgi:hypothetical protein
VTLVLDALLLPLLLSLLLARDISIAARNLLRWPRRRPLAHGPLLRSPGAALTPERVGWRDSYQKAERRRNS